MNLLEFMVDLNNPPGTIKAFAKDVDPNKIYPWQTWERYAKGRTLVGVDEDDEDFATAGLELGEKGHKLTNNELPADMATFNPLFWATNIMRSGIASVKQNHADRSGPAGSSWGDATVTLSGGDEPHNNIQPSTTVYYWLRTA